MRIEGIENMNFGPGHHGGIPSAEELRWRQQVEAAEYEARYYPHGRPSAEKPDLGQQLEEVGRVAMMFVRIADSSPGVRQVIDEIVSGKSAPVRNFQAPGIAQHHSGMPTAAELRWRSSIEAAGWQK